jgi:hypothetical protein
MAARLARGRGEHTHGYHSVTAPLRIGTVRYLHTHGAVRVLHTTGRMGTALLCDTTATLVTIPGHFCLDRCISP